MNKTKKQKGFSWKKLGYALASLVVIIGLSIGIHEIIKYSKDGTKCPYELGSYTYYSQEGDIEGLDFSEESYVILTDQELSGPGTFVLQDKDWTVYGQFYECEFENVIIESNNSCKFIVGELIVSIYNNDFFDVDSIVIEIDNNDEYYSLIFSKN